jgi:hypothetical protein
MWNFERLQSWFSGDVPRRTSLTWTDLSEALSVIVSQMRERWAKGRAVGMEVLRTVWVAIV